MACWICVGMITTRVSRRCLPFAPAWRKPRVSVHPPLLKIEPGSMAITRLKIEEAYSPRRGLLPCCSRHPGGNLPDKQVIATAVRVAGSKRALYAISCRRPVEAQRLTFRRLMGCITTLLYSRHHVSMVNRWKRRSGRKVMVVMENLQRDQKRVQDRRNASFTEALSSPHADHLPRLARGYGISAAICCDCSTSQPWPGNKPLSLFCMSNTVSTWKRRTLSKTHCSGKRRRTHMIKRAAYF
jgi:hypothetical protein